MVVVVARVSDFPPSPRESVNSGLTALMTCVSGAMVCSSVAKSEWVNAGWLNRFESECQPAGTLREDGGRARLPLSSRECKRVVQPTAGTRARRESVVEMRTRRRAQLDPPSLVAVICVHGAVIHATLYCTRRSCRRSTRCPCDGSLLLSAMSASRPLGWATVQDLTVPHSAYSSSDGRLLLDLRGARSWIRFVPACLFHLSARRRLSLLVLVAACCQCALA